VSGLPSSPNMDTGTGFRAGSLLPVPGRFSMRIVVISSASISRLLA